MTKHTKKIIGISAGSALAAGGLGWWYLSTHPQASTVPTNTTGTTPSQTSASPGPSGSTSTTQSAAPTGYTTNQAVSTPSATSAVLTWAAASGAASYKLIDTATGTLIGTTTATTYTLTGLTPGARYQVSIDGCTSGGECTTVEHQGSVTWIQPISVNTAAQTATYQATNTQQTPVVISTVVEPGYTYAPPSQSQVNQLAAIQNGSFSSAIALSSTPEAFQQMVAKAQAQGATNIQISNIGTGEYGLSYTLNGDNYAVGYA